MHTMTEQYDEWGAAAAEAAAASDRSTPIPAGTYDFEVHEYEIVDFANDPNSPYHGEKALKLQLLIADGQAQANRRVFPRIGLFPRYRPSEKNPTGLVNEDLFSILQKAFGWTLDEIKAFVLAARAGQNVDQYLRRIAGARLSGKVRIVPDTHPKAAPDAKTNEVRYFDKAKGVSAAGSAVGGAVSADIWGAGAVAAAPAQAAPAADIWGTAAAAQPAVPAQPVAAAQAAWPPAAAAAQPNPALAAAAAAGGGY
jgi:hypothetical protein